MEPNKVDIEPNEVDIEPNKVDRLYLATAYKKKVDEYVKDLKNECDEEFLEEYRTNGTTQKRSTFFGKGAGTYTIPIKEAKPPQEVIEFNMTSLDEYEEWLADNPHVCLKCALRNWQDLAERHFNETGECPEGIARVAYETEWIPEQPGTPTLRVKPDVITSIMGAKMIEEVNYLLLGEPDVLLGDLDD